MLRIINRTIEWLLCSAQESSIWIPNGGYQFLSRGSCSGNQLVERAHITRQLSPPGLQSIFRRRTAEYLVTLFQGGDS